MTKIPAKIKIYTKTGDEGQTSLLNGIRVSKGHPRLAAYGDLDELNSHVGLSRSLIERDLLPAIAKENTALQEILRQIQNNLFVIGSIMAWEPPALNDKPPAWMPILPEDCILQLEKEIDCMEAALTPLKEFILPAGSIASCQIHVTRSVCRRAERKAQILTGIGQELVYLNRLSDYLFVLSRYINHLLGVEEVKWTGAKK